jgi:predicted Holliday junction resolvase-like endonuclease
MKNISMCFITLFFYNDKLVSVLKTNEVNKRKLINSFDEQKSAKKTQLNEKNTILEKKKFAEERKKRLDELQKTIRKVAKDSVKKKVHKI